MKKIIKRGRTISAVVHPKKYPAFAKIPDRKSFDEVWDINPDAIFANMAHAAYHDEDYLGELFNKYGASIKFYESLPDKIGLVRGREAFLAIWDDKAILAFRGTEANDKLKLSINDKILHFASRYLKVDLPKEIKLLFPTDIYDDVRFKKKTVRESGGESQVHGGFYNATMDLWPEILRDLEDINLSDPSQVYVTGHSLGAAMAVVAGIMYAFKKIVTFGEPSVGNDLDNTIDVNCQHIRYVNGKDPITRIVPKKLFEHHGICKKIVDIDGPDIKYDHSIINYADILLNQ
ncbi:MAG: lipase family protein [Nitrospinales bacterium]